MIPVAPTSGHPRESDWELTVFGADPPTRELASLAAGDIDGDGNVKIITGGQDVLLWYRPATLERGTIAQVRCAVGVTLEDIDGDGKLEVVLGKANPSNQLLWFNSREALGDAWQYFVIDEGTIGHSHDVRFADIDGDGENELIANAVYCGTPGLYAYKRNADPNRPWRKSCLQSGIVEEGLMTADLDGDGQIEIVSGPDWYHAPAAGPFSGLWERHVLAPSHREMWRVALLDVTRSGLPDILIADSEYLDGRLSWFENRPAEDRRIRGSSTFWKMPLYTRIRCTPGAIRTDTFGFSAPRWVRAAGMYHIIGTPV